MRGTSSFPLAGRLIVATLLLGCSSERREWQRAESLGTPEAYEAFLAKHASGDLADSAKTRSCALRVEQSISQRSMEAFRLFIAQCLDNRRASDAAGHNDQLRGQIGFRLVDARTGRPGDYGVSVFHVTEGQGAAEQAWRTEHDRSEVREGPASTVIEGLLPGEYYLLANHRIVAGPIRVAPGEHVELGEIAARAR
jgi:hypothetical protein